MGGKEERREGTWESEGHDMGGRKGGRGRESGREREREGT